MLYMANTKSYQLIVKTLAPAGVFLCPVPGTAIVKNLSDAMNDAYL